MGNWRTSSYSSGDGGQCVEVASGDEIMVRDTTDRPGPMLTFTADAWRAFMASVRQRLRSCWLIPRNAARRLRRVHRGSRCLMYAVS
jgi:hypothetical protein